MLDEASPDDTDGDGDEADAETADQSGKDLAEGGVGGHVPIADSGDGDNTPPHRRRDGDELGAGQALLDNVH